MSIATVTSEGQITIPAAVRLALSLDVGSRIEFVELGQGRYAIVPVSSPVRALKGLLRKPEQAVSIADMEQAIATRGAKIR
jgi:AbrB family looped-hinge helix DNA binding protein